MGVIETIKQAFGGGNQPNQYRCQECDTSFESHMDPDTPVLRCPECEAREIELIGEGT